MMTPKERVEWLSDRLDVAIEELRNLTENTDPEMAEIESKFYYVHVLAERAWSEIKKERESLRAF